MKLSLYKLLLLAVFLASALPSWASFYGGYPDQTVNGVKYAVLYDTDLDGYVIFRPDGNSSFYTSQNLTNVVIPESFTITGNAPGTKPVKGILWRVFENCSTLKSCTLPSTLVKMWDNIWLNAGLESITIPANVTEMGDACFAGCKSLRTVTFTNHNKMETLPNWTFVDCEGLTSVTLPQGLKRIGDVAFQTCPALTTINFPEGLTSIGGYAFANSGITSISLPESLVSIGGSAFIACDIRNLVVPANVTEIGERCFANNSNMQSAVFLNTMSRFNENVLTGSNASLRHLTLPKGYDIRESEFHSWGELRTLVISDGTDTVPKYGFAWCGKLNTVTFPASLKILGESSFYRCDSLKHIDFGSNSQLNTIGNNAFQYTGLEHFTCPPSLTIIGNGAFADDGALKSVKFNRGLLSIGQDAFINCKQVKTFLFHGMLRSTLSTILRYCAPDSVILLNTDESLLANWNANTFGDLQGDNTHTLYVLPGMVDAFQACFGGQFSGGVKEYVPQPKAFELGLRSDAAVNQADMEITYQQNPDQIPVYLVTTNPDGTRHTTEAVVDTYGAQGMNSINVNLKNRAANSKSELYAPVTDLSINNLDLKSFSAGEGNQIQTFTADGIKWSAEKFTHSGLKKLSTLSLKNIQGGLKDIDFSGMDGLNSINIENAPSGITTCALDRSYMTLPRQVDSYGTFSFSSATADAKNSATSAANYLGWEVSNSEDPVAGNGSGCDSLYLSWVGDDENAVYLASVTGVLLRYYDSPTAIAKSQETVVGTWVNGKVVTAMQINGKNVSLSEGTTFTGSSDGVTSGFVTVTLDSPQQMTLSQLAEAGTLPAFKPISIPAGSAYIKYVLPGYALALREADEVATKQVPAEDHIDLMARYGQPYTGFAQHRWAEVSVISMDGEEHYSPDWLGYYKDQPLPYDMQVTPNVYASNAYKFWQFDLREDPSPNDPTPVNTYVLAAFDGVQSGTNDRTIFFVRPADAEICKILAEWDGRRFIIPTAAMRNLLGRTVPDLQGSVSYNFNTGDVTNLEAGKIYEFTAYVRYNQLPVSSVSGDASDRRRISGP